MNIFTIICNRIKQQLLIMQCSPQVLVETREGLRILLLRFHFFSCFYQYGCPDNKFLCTLYSGNNPRFRRLKQKYDRKNREKRSVYLSHTKSKFKMKKSKIGHKGNEI